MRNVLITGGSEGIGLELRETGHDYEGRGRCRMRSPVTTVKWPSNVRSWRIEQRDDELDCLGERRRHVSDHDDSGRDAEALLENQLPHIKEAMRAMGIRFAQAPYAETEIRQG